MTINQLHILNAYPSAVFVGDVFCYFSGMLLLTIGAITDQFWTVFALHIPQIINAALSVPQLLGIVPCPRHRMPGYDPADDQLVPSHCSIPLNNKFGCSLARLLAKLKLVAIEPNSDSIKCSNLTILNSFLINCPRNKLSEKELAQNLIFIQYMATGCVVLSTLIYNLYFS